MTQATDEDRHPTLSPAGLALMQRMRAHPAAPRFRNHSGSRLRHDDLEDAAAFEQATLDASIEAVPGGPPAWLAGFLSQAYAEVPRYRARGAPPRELAKVPTISRADLASDVAGFVPDGVPAERLISFTTTGTTGHPLTVPSHPRVAARYLTFHKRALARVGITPRHGRGEVGVVLLGHQRRCFTYVSVTPSMGESGLAKLNLHPGEWNDPADRARYLDWLAPEILAGDPISFASLLELPVSLRPRALLSVSMMLTAGLRMALEARFGCPALDIYSLNEVGPVGVFDPAAGGHVLLQPRLYVEIVDDSGRALGPGARGEICVTGGFNFCLPLVRYRTGDFAALEEVRGEPVLRDLAGRRPVRFRTASGVWLNNVDVSHALGHLPLAQYALHQGADGALRLRLSGAAQAAAATEALHGLLGELPIAVEALDVDDKVLQYSSDHDLAGGHSAG